MRKTIITISDSGKVSIPAKVSMRSFEVADLFGVFTQTINTHVRTLIKSGAVSPNTSGQVMTSGGVVVPLDLGLDMITALAFRLDSRKAELFRQCLMDKIFCPEKQPANVYLHLLDNSPLN